MKTLVIHPSDETTDFLQEIYRDKDWTISRGAESAFTLQGLIRDHERIIMLGHGTPQGLLGKTGFVIDGGFVSALRTKECVCIWCNADQFVMTHGLKGLYTGMIISEVEEAKYLHIDATQEEVTNSNNRFAYAVRESIEFTNPSLNIKRMYRNGLKETNRVINYNKDNIYYEPSLFALQECYRNFTWKRFDQELPTTEPGGQVDIFFGHPGWAIFVQGIYTHDPEEELKERLMEYRREVDKYWSWESIMPTHWMKAPENPNI